MSTLIKVITDAPVAGQSQVAKIAATSVATAGLGFAPGSLQKLLLNNAGPNLAYVLVSSLSGALAAVPGAAFAPGGLPVAVGDKPTLDVSKMKPDANGLLYLSVIADAAGTASLLATAY